MSTRRMAPPQQSHTFMEFVILGVAYRGWVVPQSVYQSESPYDPCPPIRFHEGHELGVPLGKALLPEFFRSQPCCMLDGWSRPIILTTSPKAILRILWPGYHSWDKQITVLEQSRTHGSAPMIKARLAHEVAKAVRKFYLDNAHMISSDPTAGSWQLRSVPFERLLLLELRQVSAGSWQPVLAILDY